jgi:hypothetical protein
MAMRFLPPEMDASSLNTGPKAKEQPNRRATKVKTQPNNDQLRDCLRDMRLKNAAVRKFVKKKKYHEKNRQSHLSR